MKIFISIASYQDLLLPITINSAYTNAKFKENLRFGIIDQCKVKLCLLYTSDAADDQ